MACNNGPSTQTFDAVVTMVRSAAAGTTLTVRVDGTPAPPESHVGLYFLYNFVTEFRLTGARLVEGSLRVLPDTGTANMRPGTRVTAEAGGVLRLVNPAQIPNGAAFNTPSFEFSMVLDGAPGTEARLLFQRYSLDARVFLLGNINTHCTPRANPSVLGAVRITAP